MADSKTMEELLQAPTEGYGEAIVILEINADHFEIKTILLQLVQANPYHGFERENPHTRINNFKRITLTLKFRDVSNDVIKLMMFPYSLEGAAKACASPHHGFTELTQIDMFHNGLNENDQDSLNAAAGGNLLSKTTSKTDDMIDKVADQISTLVGIVSKKVVTPATVKAVEESCVTCGSNHAYYNCDATNSKQSSICVETVKREAEETTDKEQTNFQGSTAHIQPLVIPIPEPDVPKNLPKSNIPYPLRLNDQNLHEKAANQMEKIFQIFQDFHFDISFADALLLMPKFASTIKSLLANKDKLFELVKILLIKNFLVMLFKMLPEKLRDLDKFHIPCHFSRMDVFLALADLGVSINLMPLSIWKKLSLPEFTPTRMTLELADRSITRPKGVAKDIFVKVGKLHFLTDFVVVDFEADPRIPLILGRSFLRTGRALIDVYGEKNNPLVNRIDVIDVAREEYAQEMLEIDHANCDLEGDICLIEKLLNDDPFHLPRMDLKQGEVVKAKSLIEEPSELELKYLPSHLEYAYLEGIVLGHKISKNGLEVDRAKVDVIAKLPHPTTVKGVRSFLGHADFYRRFIQDFPKIARPMTHLFEKETPFVFFNAFETLKKKLTEASILVVPDWNLPFELMRDVSDFAIGAVLGQRKTKHFQPIQYASMTMTEAQIHYTTMEKEMIAVVYSFEKFRPYLVLSKSIVYTDHSALKYFLSKQDAKPILLRWVLLLQEFYIIIRDKKGTENLAADHLFRLENPHKDVFENKDINENFPLDTLGKISNANTP
nr:reverse transcriptase domain-containing protein [Tanacetum cinerariifolium]